MDGMNTIRLTTVAVLSALSAFAGEVTIRETSITLPTYLAGGYDKNPIFYTGRIYQGAQGRVYPYPMQDVLYDTRRDESYKYLTLENDWLSMGILPEHGGHLLNLTDKASGFETFYRQHVIKPALIGMLGAWTSGGVEWNFPHHHRASTVMPIDWTMQENEDGSKTIWIGETEFRQRMKWTIGLTMMKDRAVLQAENRFMNRQSYIESMLYWANVAVHCGDDYQVIFPPGCHLGADHHKNYWTSFPMGPITTARQWDPSNAADATNPPPDVADLSWWKNFTKRSRSIFAADPDNAWLAGYDHAKNAGTVHVSNRHITVGKKFFLWGNFPGARVWDTVLTDTDGPYLELMVGCWSDNQPDYSWISPYETRTVKQYWFPVKGIGGVKNVTIDGAVNLERINPDQVLLGFHSTRVLKGAKVVLSAKGKQLYTETIDIDPNKSWCKTLPVSKELNDQQLTGVLYDSAGTEVLAYTPVPPDPHTPLPAKVESPKPPAEYKTAEELYLTGLRLEQFHNGAHDPVPYYEEALKRDPGYSAANLALGIRRAREAKYAEAETFLRRAVARSTRNYTRARDAEPEYYLGVVCLEQGKLKEAEDLLWRAAWRDTYQRAAYAELAKLYCRQGKFRDAHQLIEDAIDRGAKEAKLHVIHSYIHRKLGQPELAASNLKKSFACDPLEYFGILERCFQSDGGKRALAQAEKNRGLKAQQLLEACYDYLGLGAYDEVLELVAQAHEHAAKEKPPKDETDTLAVCSSHRSPLFSYLAGYVHQLRGDLEKAKQAYREAAAEDIYLCFPSRHEEYAILRAATELTPECANTWYLFGNICRLYEQRDNALAAWKKATELAPAHALAWRNLGFEKKELAAYDTSLAADPQNFRALLERDQLAEKQGVSNADRFAFLTRYRATAEKYDACIFRYACLLNDAKRYDEALQILQGRRFHVWEGGESLLTPFVEASMNRGTERMKDGKWEDAIRDFRQAMTYPSNLQASPPDDAGVAPKAHYFIAQCRKSQGDTTAYRAELEEALKGWSLPGEMNYYRFRAMKELGKGADAELRKQVEDIRKAIADLEKKQPKGDAYAKFGGENLTMARAASRARQIENLKRQLSEMTGDK